MTDSLPRRQNEIREPDPFDQAGEAVVSASFVHVNTVDKDVR